MQYRESEGEEKMKRKGGKRRKEKGSRRVERKVVQMKGNRE